MASNQCQAAANGIADEECGDQAVWNWRPRTPGKSVRLCDEHAADCDLDDLEER